MNKPKAKPSRYFEPTSKSPSQTESPFEPTADSRPHRVSPLRQKRQSPAPPLPTNTSERKPHRVSPKEGKRQSPRRQPQEPRGRPSEHYLSPPWRGSRHRHCGFSSDTSAPSKASCPSQALPTRKPQPGAPIRARWYFEEGLVLPPCEGECFSLGNTATA
jgi:hypothetical protein